MMKNIIVLIFSFLTIISQAQMQECGTYTSPEDMEVFYNRERAPQNSLKAGNFIEIPIVYHLTRRDNGTGGFDLAETFRLHCDLNERFEDAEIHFYILDIVEHNNTGYFEMNYNGAGSAMMNNENISNACNVFIVNDAKSGSTSVCGYSFLASGWGGPNRGGVVLDIGCSGAGSTTLTHEMGHYLNLPHTFWGWEGSNYYTDPIQESQWERADGSNCSYRGDGFCDTPADYISDRWDCNPARSFNDAVGQNFMVDEKNFMSYSLDGCQAYFKQEQMDEMQNTPFTHRSYLSILTPPNTDALATPNLTFPPDNLNGLALGPVNFEWEEVPGATHYMLELSINNFFSIIHSEIVTTNSLMYDNLSSNTNYKWRVKAINYGSVCNEYRERSFKMSSFSASVSFDNVFCNGASDGNATAETSSNTINSYYWYEYDSVTNSYNNFKISTTTNIVHNLRSNSYYVELVKSSGERSIVPFVISEPSFLDVQLSQNNYAVLTTVTGGTPPYSYLWADGSTSHQNNNPVVGSNTLYLTDDNGCFLSKSYTFSSGVSAIDDVVNNITNLKVYPNPVVGNVVFMDFTSNDKTAVSLDLFSVEGKLIRAYDRSVAIGENTLVLPLNEIGKGVYYIKFSINNNTITKKIIL